MGVNNRTHCESSEEHTDFALSMENRQIVREKSRGSASPRVLILGAGCVGTYLACKLAASGVTVILKRRERKPDGAPASDIQLRIGELCEACGVHQTSSLKDLATKDYDYVFITTKTYDHVTVSEELTQCKVTARVMVALHNGVAHYPFDHKPVVQVIIPQSYDIVSDNRAPCGCRFIVRNEETPWTMPDIPAARQAVSLLRPAGINAEATDKFEVLLIRKYVVNGVANLLSIVEDATCEELCSEHWDQMQDLYDEFTDVLPNIFPTAFKQFPENFHSVVFECLASYGKHYPSSKHDFDAGKPIEIQSLNGFLVHCGKKLGIATPHNSLLMREVKRMVELRDRINSLA